MSKTFRTSITDGARPKKRSPDLTIKLQVAPPPPTRRKVRDGLNGPDAKPESVAFFPKDAFEVTQGGDDLVISRVFRDTAKTAVVGSLKASAFTLSEDGATYFLEAQPMASATAVTDMAAAYRQQAAKTRERIEAMNAAARSRRAQARDKAQ